MIVREGAPRIWGADDDAAKGRKECFSKPDLSLRGARHPQRLRLHEEVEEASRSSPPGSKGRVIPRFGRGTLS